MTGLKASTLFRAYVEAEKAVDYWDNKCDWKPEDELSDACKMLVKREGQASVFFNKLTAKLKAQEKELEQLRSENQRLKNQIFKAGWEEMAL